MALTSRSARVAELVVLQQLICGSTRSPGQKLSPGEVRGGDCTLRMVWVRA